MAANDKEVLMKADHVKVYFKGKKKGQTVKAVDDVSFEIMKGETFGVVGESGCGKSTLGRTLIRLQQPTDGHIYLNGTDIACLKGAQLKEMRKEAQIIFQDPSACLNPRRTIKQILMEPFEIHNLKGKIDVDAKIMELLQLVGLDSYHLSRYPHELSGGQKQRIGIARALALEPQIIICDEAVSALDVSVQAQVLNLLQELKEKLGLTYFFISHNLNVVYQVSDRVGVMYLGKMVRSPITISFMRNAIILIQRHCCQQFLRLIRKNRRNVFIWKVKCRVLMIRLQDAISTQDVRRPVISADRRHRNSRKWRRDIMWPAICMNDFEYLQNQNTI